MGTVSHGTSIRDQFDIGMVLRADITRINGTYWNISGYWRGRLSSQSSTGQQTLQDLINRTYHLSMTYDNPNSAWVAGFGRLYLPWAPSLDTIDGGYFGAQTGPRQHSWNLRRIDARSHFLELQPGPAHRRHIHQFQGGNYEAFHYTSTSGLGVSTLEVADRPAICVF